MVKRSKLREKDYLNTSNIPKQRRFYHDYDYLNKLSRKQKDWLTKFSLEYYGADFTINDTFLKRTEMIELLSVLVRESEDERVRGSLEFILNETIASKAPMIKVSNNSNKKLNIDLRKLRKIDKYYQLKDGTFSSSKEHKYSKQNLHKSKRHMAACNDAVCALNRDMSSIFAEKEYISDDRFSIIETKHSDITTLDPQKILEFFEKYEDSDDIE